MKINVIGCSGAEIPGHNAPSFLLNDEIVLDAGSITSALNIKSQLRIKHIFITHAHLDHIRSIPFLTDNIILGKNRHTINLYSINPVISTIKKHLFNSSMWPDFTLIPDPENAILNLSKLRTNKPVKINGYTVTPYRVNHPVPAVGYLVEDKKNRKLFYTGDTGPTPKTWEKIKSKKLNCLIIDVSFPDRMREMAISTGHLTPQLLKEEIATMYNLPEKICITHPKPQYFKVIQSELKKTGLKNVHILKEGEIIRV